MFVCQACHEKSKCPSTIHLNITRGKCETCGHVSTCFSCNPGVPFTGRNPRSPALIAMYRNTKQLRPYRKISL